ncbi:MAG: hypothetical protein IJU70_04890 [Lentisphaeria bacterium]|nr:hypothetical protein [Lentisphaeria bacterium]
MKRTIFAGSILLLAGFLAGTLHADILVRDRKGGVIYQYSNGVMYKGHARNNKKLFKYDAGRGEIWSMNGKRLAFWKNSENALYPGNGGRPMYIYADKGGHPGSKGAKAVIYIDGRKIYHGHGPGCELILYPDSALPTPVALYLAHTVTGGKAPAKPAGGKVKVDFSSIPYGYYLGPKGEGKILLSLRGNRIFFNDTAKGMPAYTFKGTLIYRGPDTKQPPAFCLADNGSVYRGGKVSPENLVMALDWFNCYAPGKSGQDAIGTVQYAGENILTEGYTRPSQKPDFTGKRILLSSTLPNNRIPLGMRIFLVYLTQLDPEFRAGCRGQK